MSITLHPYMHTHFAGADGSVPWQPCATRAIVVTQDPAKTTCPVCRDNLHRLTQCWTLVETCDDDPVTP